MNKLNCLCITLVHSLYYRMYNICGNFFCDVNTVLDTNQLQLKALYVTSLFERCFQKIISKQKPTKQILIEQKWNAAQSHVSHDNTSNKPTTNRPQEQIPLMRIAESFRNTKHHSGSTILREGWLLHFNVSDGAVSKLLCNVCINFREFNDLVRYSCENMFNA